MFIYSNYIKQIDAYKYCNETFKTTRFRSKFVIDHLEKLVDPDHALKECIQHSIDQTILESRANGMEIDRVGVSISSNLLDYDLYVPTRKITANTTDSILNLFSKVSQSKGRNGSLLGQAFTVTVTGVRTVDLPKTKQIIGSGKIRTKLIKRKIDDNSLITINNDD